MTAHSLLDDEVALAAVAAAGYGILVLSPSAGSTADDNKIERIVIRMAEHLKEFGMAEDANYVELVCAATEFAARVVAAPLSMQQDNRKRQRKVAYDMAKNLHDRILGALRLEGAGQESKEQ